VSAPALVVHDGDHGVAVYARQLAETAAGLRAGIRRAHRPDLGALTAGSALHAHVTDRLWADSPEAAADAVEALGRRHRLSVTLHDVPQASDGPRNRPRRRDAYRRIAAAAVGVAVNSEHERMLLTEEGVYDGAAAVLPLPVDIASDVARPAPSAVPDVAVLGYFYPGKGHDEALAAAVAAGIRRMTVLGRASDGHADDLAAFVDRAAALGVTVEVTGWIPDAELVRRAAAVAVPVVAHRHISASGSLASWIAVGRRPIAVRGRYVDEMDRLRPGTLCVVGDDALGRAVRAAAAEPDTTWHGLDAVPAGAADVAAAYLRWWDTVHA
jgi:hypothetical protein